MNQQECQRRNFNTEVPFHLSKVFFFNLSSECFVCMKVSVPYGCLVPRGGQKRAQGSLGVEL